MQPGPANRRHFWQRVSRLLTSASQTWQMVMVRWGGGISSSCGHSTTRDAGGRRARGF